jgi:hypothetical protein
MDENVVFNISAKSDIQKAIADLNSFAAALGKFKTTDINVLTGGGATGVKAATQGTQGFAAALREEAVAINAISKVDLANIHANMARSAAQARSETTALVSSLETETAVTRALASADAASIGAKAKLTTAKAAQTAASLRESKANEAVAVSAQKAAIAQTELANRTNRAQVGAIRAQAGAITSAAALANAQAKVAVAGKKVAIDLGAAGAAASRMASRFAFLTSAVVAGFAFDVISNAAQDFAKLEGSVRGLEIASARAGVAGRKMFDDLRSGAEGFRFKAAEAADAINKLLIGGLKPSAQQMGFAGKVAAGASIMFGEEPSKMLNDLATAALRVSYRMADNLGIVMRANTAYEMYAKKIGKTAKELTGLEKVQAFWEAMMGSTSAKVLAAAASLDTLQMKFQRAKVTVNDFYLALGENIAKSIIPVADALNRMGKSAIDGAAHFTILIAKAALLATGIGLLTRAIQGYIAASAVAKRVSLWLAALQVVAMAVTYAYDRFQDKAYETSQAIADSAQRVIMYQQTLASLGIVVEEVAEGHNRLLTALNAIGAAPSVVDYFQRFSGAIESVKGSIDSMLENSKKVSPEMQKIADDYKEALDGINEDLLKVAETSKTGSEAMAKAQKLAIEDMVDALKEYKTKMLTASAVQQDAADSGLSAWQALTAGIGENAATIVDIVINLAKTIGNALATAGKAAGAAIAASFASFANMFPGFINDAIDSLNKFIAKLRGFGIPRITVTKGPLGIPLLSTGAKWQPFAGASDIRHIGAAGGGGGMSKEGWKVNYEAAAKELGLKGSEAGAGTAGANAVSAWDALMGMGPPAPGSIAGRVQDYWGTVSEMQRRKNQAALQEELDALRKRVLFDMSLLDTGAGGGKGKGGKGKGGKSLADVYKEAVEKLEEQLKEIDAHNKQLAEIYPITSKTRQLAEEKLARDRDEALLDFEITAKEKGFYDLLSKQHPELVKQIAAAKERLRIADKINEEYNKALQSAKENLEESKRENELRKQLGLAVDDTKIAQQNLDTAIKFAAEWGMSLVDSMRALNMSALDVKAAFDALRDEAQQAVDKARQLRLDWDLSQMSYKARLQAAREVDPNRRQAIGFNAAYDEFLRKFQEVGKTEPASQAAMELSQTLRDLQVEMEQTATDMRENLRKQGLDEVNQMLSTVSDDITEMMSALNPEGYIAKQEQKAQSQMDAVSAQMDAAGALNISSTELTSSATGLQGSATQLNQSASTLTGSGIGLSTAAGALVNSAGALSSAAAALIGAANALAAAGGGGGGAPPPGGGGAAGLGAAVGAALWQDLSALSEGGGGGGGYQNVGPPTPAASGVKAGSAAGGRAKEIALALKSVLAVGSA